jgi:regulator of nucleoside diphosphate kinase
LRKPPSSNRDNGTEFALTASTKAVSATVEDGNAYKQGNDLMKVQNIFTHADRCRLGQLLSSDDARGVAPQHMLDDLECLLEEAEGVESDSIRDDVVTMNSTVLLVNTNSAAELICTVVYPEDVELIDGGISVLEPLGTRLIGCEVGDLIECESRSNPGPWRIAKILFQPEQMRTL